MAIPSLDSEGFLPPGVHDCTLDEIKARFGSFQRSDRPPSSSSLAASQRSEDGLAASQRRLNAD